MATAPAQAAAQVHLVHIALRQRETSGFGQRGQRAFGALRGHPGLGPIARDAHRAVHGLHRGVGQEGAGVGGFYFLDRLRDGSRRIAFFALPEVAVGREAFAQHGVDGGAGRIGVDAVVPHHGQFSQGCLGMPEGVGHHGERAVVDLDHAFDTAHLGNLAVIKAHQLAAKHGALHDGSVEHAGQLQIDAESLATIDLVGRVQSTHRLARNAPLAGFFLHDLGWIGCSQLGRIVRHFAVAQCAA